MRNDGGPAFPVECYFDKDGPSSGIQTSNVTGFVMGVSVRDYFAGKALQGMYANPSLSDLPHDRLARAALDSADAMLKARGEDV